METKKNEQRNAVIRKRVTHDDFGSRLHTNTDEDDIRTLSVLRRVLFPHTQASDTMSLRLVAAQVRLALSLAADDLTGEHM